MLQLRSLKRICLVLTVCAVLCGGVAAFGQGDFDTASVTFFDRSFEAFIRTVIARPQGSVLPQDLAGIIELNAPDLDIASIEGIQPCVNLKTLNLAGNRITNVKPLAELNQLSAIDLSNNRISDIAPLAANNAIGSGDVVTLEGNPLTQASICLYIPVLKKRGTTVIFSGNCAPDRDGDGLSDQSEVAFHGTDPYHPDSDRDGMADGFEVANGLDPLDAADAGEDADEDGLTNIEEFHRGSDPTSAASPAPTFFVSPAGSDVLGDGSFGLPWQSIANALGHTVGYSSVNIALLGGIHAGGFELNPGCRLVGIRPGVVILGGIVGAEGAALVNLEVAGLVPVGPTPPPLLRMDNVAMSLRKVTFRGSALRLTTGLVVTGDAPAASLVSGCAFTSLRIGIEIFGAIPRIVRSTFNDLSASAIIFRNPPQQKNYADSDGVPAVSDGNSGYNSFTDIDGPFIVNERPQRISMRNNYWGTEDPDLIALLVAGDVDTEASLKSGGIVPATIICCVWDAETMQPVTTATMYLGPGAFLPLTENTGGVYTFACVPVGDYTITAVTDGYLNYAQDVSVNSGDEVSLVFPLEAGEEGGGGGCAAGSAVPSDGGVRTTFILFIGIAILLALSCRPSRRFPTSLSSAARRL